MCYDRSVLFIRKRRKIEIWKNRSARSRIFLTIFLLLIIGTMITPTLSQSQINQKAQGYNEMISHNFVTLTNTTVLTTSYSTTLSIVETSADPGGYKFFVWSGYFDFNDNDIIKFETNGLIKVTDPEGETLYQGGETTLYIKEPGTYRIYITVGHGLVLYIRIYRVTIVSSTSTIIKEYTQTTTSNQTMTNTTLITSTTHNSTSTNQTSLSTTTSIDTAVPGLLPESILLGLITGIAIIGLLRRFQHPSRRISPRKSKTFENSLLRLLI